MSTFLSPTRWLKERSSTCSLVDLRSSGGIILEILLLEIFKLCKLWHCPTFEKVLHRNCYNSNQYTPNVGKCQNLRINFLLTGFCQALLVLSSCNFSNLLEWNLWNYCQLLWSFEETHHYKHFVEDNQTTCFHPIPNTTNF